MKLSRWPWATRSHPNRPRRVVVRTKGAPKSCSPILRSLRKWRGEHKNVKRICTKHRGSSFHKKTPKMVWTKKLYKSSWHLCYGSKTLCIGSFLSPHGERVIQPSRSTVLPGVQRRSRFCSLANFQVATSKTVISAVTDATAVGGGWKRLAGQVSQPNQALNRSPWQVNSKEKNALGTCP